MLLEGRTAVITGAASGIGRATAGLFGREGASVLIADIDLEAARDTARELGFSGIRAQAARCDVTDEDSVAAAVAAAVDTSGVVDVHVEAGFTRDAVMRKMSVEDFLAVLHVHVLGTWLGTRAAAAAMRERGGGSIVNMSSISGKVGNPGQTNYSAAKAGIVGLTKAAAKEGARHGVRVNAIQPGLIETGMTAAMPADVLADRLKEVPLGRIGEADDVAKAALFLASDLSSYITGTVIEVAGGRNM